MAALIARIADCDAPVLLEGETGTGKEMAKAKGNVTEAATLREPNGATLARSSRNVDRQKQLSRLNWPIQSSSLVRQASPPPRGSILTHARVLIDILLMTQFLGAFLRFFKRLPPGQE